MTKVKIDIGSTYIKLAVAEKKYFSQFFRDFTIPIHDDLLQKCGEVLASYRENEISICSSANEGLKVFCVGLTESFSLQFLNQIALNAGGNITGSMTLHDLQQYNDLSVSTDLLLIAGGVDLKDHTFPQFDYLDSVKSTIQYKYVAFAGNAYAIDVLRSIFPDIIHFENVMNGSLSMCGKELLEFISNQYQKDIVKKEEISSLYSITSNTIYPTPFVVNIAYQLANINKNLDGISLPFIAIDIGGATTDIHYSKEIVLDKREKQTFNRIVFKNLGTFKSKDSLLNTFANNEYAEEFRFSLGLPDVSGLESLPGQDTSTQIILAKLALFMVLVKSSALDNETDLNLDYSKLRSVLITGGASKILTVEDVGEIILFFYTKLQIHKESIPNIVIDSQYNFWSNGFKN